MRPARHGESLKAAIGRATPDVHGQCRLGLARHDKKLDYGERFEHWNDHG
jgi:hypothetical protein